MIGFLLPPKLPNTNAALRDAKSGRPESQWVAAVALGQEAGSLKAKACAALMELMKNPYEEIRAQALEGLAEQSRHGASIDFDVVITALSDPSPAVRCVAVDALCIMPGTSDEVHLLPLLEDSDPSVRAAAAAATADLEIPAATTRLSQMLDDSVWFVRLQAAIALAYLRNHDGVSILIDALEKHPQDAVEAARALGHLGNARAVPPLDRIASRRFGDTALKAVAAVSLHRCSSDGRAETRLLKLLSARNTDTRLTTLSAIAALPTTAIASHVGKLLADRDTLVASTAIETLRALADVDRKGVLSALEAGRDNIPAPLKKELMECIQTIKGNRS